MPRGFRIAFPGGSPQAPRTLVAEHGRFTLTGRASTLVKDVPLVANDEWQALFTSTVIGASPSMNNAWVTGCVIKTTGEFFFGHQQVGGAQSRGGAWFFNPVTSTWRMTNTNQTQWWRSIGFRENYDCVYDPDRESVWIGTGGPVDWTVGNDARTSPVYGSIRYDIQTDTFYNEYPQADSVYSPTTDAAYFKSANKGLGLLCGDHKWFYKGGYLFTLGGWSPGTGQNFRKLNPSTNTATTLTTYGAGLPPMNKDDGRYTCVRAALDSRTNRFYLMADDGAIYTYDNTPSALTRTWSLLATTGTGPSLATPAGETGTTNGVVIAIDEASNHLVAWCSAGGIIEKTNTVRRTWLLDLATLAWRAGPSATGGATVPPGGACAVQQSMDYDPVGKRVLLALSPQATYTTQLWSFRAGSTHPGKITSFALPSFTGSVYGVNYNKFPYLANSNSKHTNMCYCPLDNRIYVTGGDTGGASAQDGTWSMSLADGSWRLDVGRPVYPTLPAPSAYQDNEGFDWMPSRSKFIFFPGSGTFGYGGNVFQYGEGLWYFDPVAKTWEQDLRLFTGVAWTTSAQIDFALTMNNTTGCIHGGIYDGQTDIIYAPISRNVMRRYSVANGVRLSDAPFTGWNGVSPYTGYSGIYWNETKAVQVGRFIFMPGAAYNGIQTKWILGKWNIDTNGFAFCAAPPIPEAPGTGQHKEQRIGVSHNTIVWPKVEGADGVIRGIYLYDIDTDSWSVDNQVPGYGNMLCNAITSLPDGRVAFSGGVFGPQMTHIWFYEVF